MSYYINGADISGSLVSKDIFTENGLYAWGINGLGSVGDNSIIDKNSPVRIGSLTNWKQVSIGLIPLTPLANSFAIKTDGSLWAWGENSIGQLGNGTSGNSYSSPIQIGSLTNWKQVSAAGGFTHIIKTDNTLWTCGYNIDGQLGNGTRTNYSSPIQVGSLTNWKQVSNFGYGGLLPSFVAAIKTDGSLWVWGSNTGRQLTVYSVSVLYSSPIQVGSLTNWKQVATGQEYISAIKTDGSLWVWGNNVYGQFGNGTYGNIYSSPIQVGSLTNWKQVACGYYHTMAIKTDGTLWTWGYNTNGQLGNGTITHYSSPIQIGSLTNWKQVSCSGFNSAAIKTDGSLWAWGDDAYGQLGNGTSGNSYSSPIQIGSLTNWKQVSIGICSFAIQQN
jgi:alpha-tubulin suppressor-like RCC1 family protein